MEIPQLKNTMSLISNLANTSSQSVFARQARSQAMREQTLASMMLQDQKQQNGLENYHAQISDKMMLQDQANRQAQETASQGDEGQSQAMLDWSDNVIATMDPQSPQAQQAIRARQMLLNRKRGSSAYNSGYLKTIRSRGIDDPLNQGILGGVMHPSAPRPVPVARQKPTQNYGVHGDSDYND